MDAKPQPGKEQSMKKVLAALALVTFTAGMALGDDTIVLPAKNMGNITFPHKKHKEMFTDCKPCHESASGGKIADLGKEWAHKTCKGCHETKKNAPTKCGECHKK
jgi:hypothetical protein